MPSPVVTSLEVEPLDTTWCVCVCGGSRAPRARTVTHFPGGGAGPDSTAPTAPALHTLGSAGSQRGAWGGAPQHLSLESPARCTSGPPLTLRGTRSCRKGASGNSLDPSARRCPVRRLPIHPPEGGARGRCPMEREAGAVCCGSRDLSRSCVSQPPHPC